MPTALVDYLEASLRDLLAEVEPPPPRLPPVGSPPVVSASLLWSALLVCVLRGFSAQRALWQRIGLTGFWHFTAATVTSQAVYQRLARTPPLYLSSLFCRLTTLLLARHKAVNDVPFAAFAGDIVALDHSTLDAVLRKLKLFREVPRGAAALLPGQLATVFDLRRQLWRQVEFWPDAQRNEKHDVAHWLPLLTPGTLILADLGFFSFPWFDRLTQEGFFYLSRWRQKTSFKVQHTFFEGLAGSVSLCDQLVYLGIYRADRAAHVVRLITVTGATGVHRYLTNVLDPALLPPHAVVELYRRRWDLERAFHFLKTHLNLFLLWSGHPNVVQHQVWATLILAQVVLSFRNEVAQEAAVPLRDVSLPQLLRWLPELAATGEDPVAVLVARGKHFGIIRPYRGKEYQLPQVSLTEYTLPCERPPPRAARYAGKQGQSKSKPNSPSRPDHRARKRAWGKRARSPRSA